MRTNYFSTTIALPATGTVQTQPMTIEHLEGYSYIINVPSSGSTAAGTVTIQGSNNALLDSQQAGGGPFTLDSNAVWVTITGTSQSVTSGANTIMYNVSSAYYKYVRLNYAASSGTATATYYFLGKGPQS
jgi:hypothetical protein